MAERTEIAWCDSTFNPWTGCQKVSPGCDACYAESWSKRAGAKVGKWGPGAPRVRTSAANWRKPLKKWNAEGFFECKDCGWRGGSSEFDVDAESASSFTAGIPACPACNSMDLVAARRRVFCASLADVFDNEVPKEWRRDLFNLIAETPNLDWLLLTKRIGNAKRMMDEIAWNPGRPGPCTEWQAMPNVWIGATIVNQAEADRDIPKLLATPAAVRFLSMEPLLGPVDLSGLWSDLKDPKPDVASHPVDYMNFVDWVIVGGESGPKARPMHPDWARSLRDQCAAAGVPFLFKQWGEWAHDTQPGVEMLGTEHSPLHHWGDLDYSIRIGKKAAGRLLDGVEHNAFPEASRA